MPKTVAEKLLIKPNTTVWTSEPERLSLLQPLPDGVQPASGLDQAGTALLFASDEASLRKLLKRHASKLADPEVLWVAYPKGNKADINRDSVWSILGEYGMRPIAQVAVDEVWSALRFRPLWEGEEQFTGGRR
jgi:hypothetical protein